jgi:uncharacterized membrane protein
MSESFARPMFSFAALWNLLGGTFIVLAQQWIFGMDGLVPPTPRLYFYSWIALFMTFGIGYYLVSRNPSRHRDIVVLGTIGKLAFSGIFLGDWFTIPRGDVPRFLWGPVVGDLLFAALFVAFLASKRTASPGQTGAEGAGKVQRQQ